MARRRTNGIEAGLLVVLIPIAFVVWIIGKVSDAGAWPVVLGIAIVLIVGTVLIKRIQTKKRIAYLLQKYGDEVIVQRIMQHSFWQGQTAPQLLDSIGNPLGVDKKVMASRNREVWKYNSRGRNRYALRITLDNGVVISWDQKN